MTLQRTLLASAIALSLAACGGDSSSGDGSTADPNTPAQTSLSGKAADGYLQDASVCLDINLNKACDSDEPAATTDENGAFTLEATQAQIDSAPLLVEVIAGQTTDSDNPGVAIDKGYTLTAPAASDFVSPITTLIQNEIEKGATVEESVALVKAQLGTDVDITSDYIEGKSSDAQKAEFERLHKVAQVTARVIATKLDELKDDATNNGVAYADLINVINEEVSKVVSDIVSDVANVVGDFEPDTVANISKDKVELSGSNIKDKVDANNADRNKVEASLKSLIEGEGLLWFGGETSANSVPSLEYGKIYSTRNGEITEEEYASRQDLNGFDLVESQPEILRMLNSEGKWVLADDTIVGVSKAENGQETLLMQSADLSLSAKLQKVDVSGLKVADIMDQTADRGVWSGVLDENAKFPANTFAYKLKMTPVVSDYYTLYPGDWCSEEQKAERGGMCNSVPVETGVSVGTPAETFAQLTKDVADGEIAGTTIMGGTVNGGLVAEIVADGTVNYYTWDWVNPLSEVVGVGSWKDLSKNGQLIRKISAPSDVIDLLTWSNFDRTSGTSHLSVVDNFVRVVAPASSEPEEEYVFGADTLPVILENFSYPLTLGACLASLPDAEYAQKVGDTVTYSSKKFDGFETSEFVESFEYQGNTHSWLTAPVYDNITDFPSWVALTDGALQKTLFSQFDLEGNLLATEASYSGEGVYYGEEGFDADGNYGWWGSVRATLPAVVDKSEKKLNTAVESEFTKVSMNDLKSLEFEGGSFASLLATQIQVSETYEGIEEVTVPAGTFQACKVTELASYDSYGELVTDTNVSWYTNKGKVKQEIRASWSPEYNRYATALPQ